MATHGSALFHAATIGDLPAVREALEATRDQVLLNAALLCSVSHGHPRVVECLLAAGAYPDTQNGKPLLNAAQRGCCETVTVLLDAGADIDVAPGGIQHAALHRAIVGGHLPVIDLLLARGASVLGNAEALIDAAQHTGRIPVLHRMLDAAPDPARATKNALINAANAGDSALVENLVRTRHPETGALNGTLAMAAIRNHVGVMTCLFQHGVDVASVRDDLERAAQDQRALSANPADEEVRPDIRDAIAGLRAAHATWIAEQVSVAVGAPVGEGVEASHEAGIGL